MTHTPGIGNFSAEMPKIGNFLVVLAVLSNQNTSYIYLNLAVASPLHDVIYETVQC